MSSKEPKPQPLHVSLRLQQAQKDAVVSMVYFNKEKDERDTADSTSWKVLIYDRFGRDIIGPLLTVSELRKNGVTLHMMLHSDRQAIPDVEAIYFCQANMDNITRILSDVRDGLYARFHLNFAGGIPRGLLEKLAAGAAHDGTYSRIASVDDQYCSFTIPFPGVFSQCWSHSFVDLHRSGVADVDMENQIRTVSTCLLSVAATLGNIPVVCAQRGGAAEMAGQFLVDMIKTSPLFANKASKSSADAKRPGFIILDRTMDLSVALSHSFSYSVMMHDLLHMRAGRVVVPDFDETGKEKSSGAKKAIDLEFSTDFFWQQNIGSPFPVLAESVESALKKYKDDIMDVQRKTGISIDEGSGEASVIADDSVAHAELAATVQSLPELRKRKKLLDAHSSIAYALLTEVKKRDIDVFAALEESMMTNYPVDEERLTQLFALERPDSTTALGTGASPSSASSAPLNAAFETQLSDRLRLFLIYFLSLDPAIAKDTLAGLETKLRGMGANLGSYEFVKRMRTFLSTPTWAQISRREKEQQGIFSGLASKAKVFGEQLRVMASGLSRGGQVTFPVARLVRDVIAASVVASQQALGAPGSSASPAHREYEETVRSLMMVDPRISSHVPVSLANVGDWIVFMIGGGSLSEYTNILQNTPPGVDVIYGCTELLSGEEFLDQLQILSAPAK
eukprot:ANDGO_04802.mRNA.1 SEC1 family transport protein SLY1